MLSLKVALFVLVQILILDSHLYPLRDAMFLIRSKNLSKVYKEKKKRVQRLKIFRPSK